MPAATGDDSIAFDEIDFFSNQIGPAVSGPEVPDIADEKGPNRSAVDSLPGVSRRIIGLLDTLCDPLNPPASLVPILLQKRRRAGIRNNGIDAVLFTYLESFKYLLVGEVVLEQRRSVEQVSAVRVAADQVASADYPADRDAP
jgi:hypothetical protein